jgi:flagellar biosynthesis GTPase FlhF
MEQDLPLSYASFGQNVPDDIRIATPEWVARLVMEGTQDDG